MTASLWQNADFAVSGVFVVSEGAQRFSQKYYRKEG